MTTRSSVLLNWRNRMRKKGQFFFGCCKFGPFSLYTVFLGSISLFYFNLLLFVLLAFWIILQLTTQVHSESISLKKYVSFKNCPIKLSPNKVYWKLNSWDNEIERDGKKINIKKENDILARVKCFHSRFLMFCSFFFFSKKTHQKK